LLAGAAIAWPLSWALSLPGPVEAAIVVIVAVGLLKLFEPRIRKAFVYHLLDGWIFSWQLAAGRRPEFEGRLDNFARHVAAAIRQTDADEVLIVGHSTGTTVAVEVTARALALDAGLGRHGPAVVLLTIGSCLPVVGFVRTADRLRRQIARLATERTLLWVEYQAPQDVLNAFGFDPVRDLDLDLGGAERVNPTIRSARFKETVLPSTYRKMRRNFFRVHFHFLMPNDIPGEYDYPMIACGPVPLSERIADPDAAVRAAYGGERETAARAAQSRAAV
jgi:pimeloyl-ACP methyl ester carboxylesterase